MPLPAIMSLLPLAMEYGPKLIKYIDDDAGDKAQQAINVVKAVAGTDDPVKAREVLQDPAKVLELQRELNDLTIKFAELQAGIITAEIKSDSLLAKNWRPMLMVLFGVIILNEYILSPYFGLPAKELPEHMWDLLNIGVGGYVLSRGAEKGVKMWKQS